MCPIDWSAIAIVVATIFGPIFAVWASEWRQQHRALHDRKEWVFRTLLATKSYPLMLDHVRALTQIEAAFLGSAPEVLEEWSLYLKHLRSPQGESEAAQTAWHQTSGELLRNILKAMADHLKIPLSKLQLNEKTYYPDGYVISEIRQQEIQELLLAVLKDGRPINIRTIIDPKP